MNRVRAYTQLTIHHLNRLARANSVGVVDTAWLATMRDEHKLPADLDTGQLISKLQDIYAAQAVAERLTEK